MSVDQFNNQWLSGSVSLKELSENWPASELKMSTKETKEMKTCQNTCCKLCSSYTKQWMVPWPQYLIWTKLTRLTAWIIRFLDNSRLMNEHWHFRSLSGNEIRGHPLSMYARFSEKLTLLTLIHTRTSGYQEVCNVIFLENFVYVIIGWPFNQYWNFFIKSLQKDKCIKKYKCPSREKDTRADKLSTYDLESMWEILNCWSSNENNENSIKNNWIAWF